MGDAVGASPVSYLRRRAIWRCQTGYVFRLNLPVPHTAFCAESPPALWDNQSIQVMNSGNSL